MVVDEQMERLDSGLALTCMASIQLDLSISTFLTFLYSKLICIL